MPKKTKYDYDLIVIGSGTSGSVAASIAAASDKRVALIESDKFGGESPNWGDIPVRAMLHATTILDRARTGSRFGLRTNTLGFNYPSILRWRETAMKRSGNSDNRSYYERQGITVFHGPAHFLSPNEISVNRRHLSASNFLIATGSHLVPASIAGLSDVGYYTPKTFHDLRRPPKKLLIIGGGPASIEYAYLLATLGTKVSIAERAARLLPREDEEVSDLITRELTERHGVNIITQCRVLSVSKKGNSRHVLYGRGGHETQLVVDDILLLENRKPVTDIGLENANIHYNADGIEVSSQLQTNMRHIFAAGDVLGNAQHQTHAALLEGRVAAHNILHPKKRVTPDYSAAPRTISVWPEVAAVGLTEDDCVRRSLDIRTSIAPLSMVARANVGDHTTGFCKLIVDKKGILLGAAIVAPGASEIIHELALAIKYELTAHELANTPHAFLSWSEVVRAAAVKLV